MALKMSLLRLLLRLPTVMNAKPSKVSDLDNYKLILTMNNKRHQ